MAIRSFSRGVSALVLLAAFAAGAQPVDLQRLPPVAVTANPLGSDLFDMIRPVSVLAGEALFVRQLPTLGETLNALVGVNSTYYGPNASRPVIRGFDGDRIRILQNGVGLLDASGTSVDHAVALETLTTKRIEVVRGPGTLLYGPNALGGAVNVIDGRIPFDAPAGASGAVDARYASPASERAFAGAVDVAFENGLALHVDGFTRKTSDLRIPDYARSALLRNDDPLPPDEEEPRGRLPNSASDSDGGAFGLAFNGKDGSVGASVTRFDSDYGTVAEETVTIRMKQTRVDVAGDWRAPIGPVTALKFRFGHSDYEHTEFEGDEVGTVFKNKGWEARIDAAHAKVGPFEGAFGLQAIDFDFSALGDEGFLPKTSTRSWSAFAYEEVRFDAWRLQFGGRYDNARVSAEADEKFGPSDRRTFDALSGSIGAIVPLGKETSIVGSFVYSERPPTYQELYADGAHVATGLIEIGDRNLDVEKAAGFELALRHRSGAWSGSVGYFYNRFRDYIGLFNTGEVDPDEDLPIYVYRPVKATILGIEAEGTFSLGRVGPGRLDLNLRADYLRGTNDDDDRPLPRISPVRFGGGLVYDTDRWNARLDVLRVQKQDRVADDELPTDGYTMLDLTFAWRVTQGRYGMTAFLRGTNLLDEDARNHVSFLKDIAPMARRGVAAGVRATF